MFINFSFLQRRDGGRHPAAARPSDRPVGHAGSAAHLPPQHHPLHCVDLNLAVDDRNNRSGYSCPGRITQQVATMSFIFFTKMQVKLSTV